MRNLKEYPLTTGEVFTALQNAQEEYSAKKQIGGTDGISLFLAEQFLRAYEEELNAYILAGPGAGNVFTPVETNYE